MWAVERGSEANERGHATQHSHTTAAGSVGGVPREPIFWAQRRIEGEKWNQVLRAKKVKA